MSVSQAIAECIGNWNGTNKLFLSWEPEPLRQSESELIVSLKGKGQFVSFEYTWSYEGEPQEGIILFGSDPKSNAAQAVWTDSWHSRDTLMVSDGIVNDDGSVDVKGYYKVEGHPEWGWRTLIVPENVTLKIIMYNVSPDGDEELAVEAAYTRI
ncbi:MAG TPA: DUF1579 family protein [Pyrinomonadaceae bacterium]|nr:DUF1579 family protein [Pyrinomonadaceae bacterium]